MASQGVGGASNSHISGGISQDMIALFKYLLSPSIIYLSEQKLFACFADLHERQALYYIT